MDRFLYDNGLRHERVNDPVPDKKKKLTYIFTFTLLSGASKGFMKAFIKAFIKAFEAPQRNVKIKIQVNFYFNTGF